MAAKTQKYQPKKLRKNEVKVYVQENQKQG